MDGVFYRLGEEGWGRCIYGVFNGLGFSTEREVFYVGWWKRCFVEGMFSGRGYFIERGWCSTEEKEEEGVLYRWDAQHTMVLSDGEERVCSIDGVFKELLFIETPLRPLRKPSP